MNTDVEAAGAGPAPPLADWFAEVEATLTRFDPRSPLCRLNVLPERWVAVPPLLFRAVRAALSAAALTGGAYDPTVLPALEAAGYDRSFERGLHGPSAPPVPGGRWRAIKLEPRLCAVWLPHGVRLDLGGIGKGLAVDAALRRLRDRRWLLLNAGGDLAVRTAPEAPPVLVDVGNPLHPQETLATIRLRRGAVATSSTLRRRWGAGMHHIIDPVTGRPADSGLVSATVIAPTAAHAEVLAKAVLVLGPERGLRLLREQRCQALLVTRDGEVIGSPGLEAARNGARTSGAIRPVVMEREEDRHEST